MTNYTQEQREQAARVLEKSPEVFQRMERFDGETTEEYQPFLDFYNALDTAIACLRGHGWVTDREPTQADADEYGNVLMRIPPDNDIDHEVGVVDYSWQAVAGRPWMSIPELPEVK